METKQEQLLGIEKIPKLMMKLAIPSIIAQLINLLYNIVDRIYIGHIKDSGNLASTGLGVTFPILTVISAFSAFAGSGGAPLAAINLGKGNKEKAEKILGNVVFLLLTFSVTLTILFLIFKTPLLYLFGASSQTYGYADEYLTIYVMGTIFVQFALGLNMFISSQGKAKIAMCSVLIGAVINIVMDPVFIFVFHMGVKGAAVATVIAQGISAAWVTFYLMSENSAIHIKAKYMKPELGIITSVIALGISPFIMQVTESAIMIVYNRGLQRYGGDLYVGSMTILQSVMQLVVVLAQGFTQGVQPIISYNYGAAKFERVKSTFKITLALAFTVTTLACLSCMIFPGFFAGFFTEKADLIRLVERALPVYIAGMWIFSVQICCQSAFVGLGQARISLFIAILRKVILLIPMIILMPKFFGVMGIYYAEPIADTLSATIAGTLFLGNYKKILSLNTLERI